jgi:AcrR family transcriptional regulator
MFRFICLGERNNRGQKGADEPDIMVESGEYVKKMGRPIGFDKEAALDAAMKAFWKRGYEGTSIADLTEVMGLNPPSIYAAFGDKKTLFQLAAKHYADGPAQYQAKALREPTLGGGIRALFRNAVEFLTDPEHQSGCMTLTGAMACSVEADSAKELMAEIRRQNEAALRVRLKQARKSGELATEVNIGDYARYLSTLLGGLAIQSASGVSRAEMKRIADIAVRHLGY